jgi:hypothetical protein
MLNFIEKFLGLEKQNKVRSLEYFFGIIIAFTLWGYHLINTGFISQEIAQKRKHFYYMN